MNTVTVKASKEYSVYIGSGLMSAIGAYIAELGLSGKVAVISDSNVYPIYGKIIEGSLRSAGFNAVSYTFLAGEERKNADTYLRILNFLAENHITRSDCVVALGGGVTGDLTGFAAATYLRGIPYIQVPTSLLAMVDSSVGGKTAVDLPAGKNLAGAFYQPVMVLCDTDALKTLPENVFRDGCAEVIKYGVLYDSELFAHLAHNGIAFDSDYVVTRCVTLKSNVVAADEFDLGERQKLNLGHTFGHAVELKSNYDVSHGNAVAIGMAIVAKAAAEYKICDKQLPIQLCNLLTFFGLPVNTALSAAEILDAAMSDKKRFGSTVNLIVPEEIGNCRIHPISVDDLKSFIEAGL